jgi:hypothetical protein
MPEYDLKSLALPRLSGVSLRAYAAALANPITRPLLMPSLLKQGGFAPFRALRLDEPPAFLPLAGAAAPAAGPMPAAAQRWVSAVNADGQYGQWAYRVAWKPGKVKPILDHVG